MADKPCVFIHTNEKQLVGALVSKYAVERNSRGTHAFDVRILHAKDHPFLEDRDGQPYLCEGEKAVWRRDDLQSFTPLRFLPPQLMGYRGRALLIDPDIFAVGDVWELLSRDMKGKAILCRRRSGTEGRRGAMASSVMLLDCGKLEHWRCEEAFDELFGFRRDYGDWMGLRLEPAGSIGPLEDEWNDFDHLTAHTKLLHNTKRHTQPWKTGLPVDFTQRRPFKAHKPKTWLRPLARRLGLGHAGPGTYAPHPDPRQESFFFGLLRECLEKSVIDEATLREQMRLDHVRHDALEVLERTPRLAA